MKRKLVQAGGSLAVTIPKEVVEEFELEKGMEVEVSVHPQTGAVTVRPGVRYFEGGKVTTPRSILFSKMAATLPAVVRFVISSSMPGCSARSDLSTGGSR